MRPYLITVNDTTNRPYTPKPHEPMPTAEAPFRPMLCHKKLTWETPEQFILRTIGQGVLATPKIDGIRCITHDRSGMDRGQRCVAMTRRGLRVPNRWIAQCLESECPPWLDGELVVGDSFQACTSGIMRYAGRPSFTFYVFDCCISLTGLAYRDRIKSLCGMRDNGLLPPFVRVLEPVFCQTPPDLLAYEEQQVAMKAEGVVYRPPGSLYVQRRCSKARPYMCALKRFQDAEALCVGVDPLWHNDNPIEIGPLGQRERATRGELMVEQAKVGALIVRDIRTNVEFRVGTGLDDAQRVEWWKHRSMIVGKMVKYRFQPHGVKEKPRCPVFLGIRDARDMDSYREGELPLGD